MGKHTSVRLSDDDCLLLEAAGMTLAFVLGYGLDAVKRKVLTDPILRDKYFELRHAAAERSFWEQSDRAAALNLSANAGCHCEAYPHKRGCPYSAST